MCVWCEFHVAVIWHRHFILLWIITCLLICSCLGWVVFLWWFHFKLLKGPVKAACPKLCIHPYPHFFSFWTSGITVYFEEPLGTPNRVWIKKSSHLSKSLMLGKLKLWNGIPAASSSPSVRWPWRGGTASVLPEANLLVRGYCVFVSRIFALYRSVKNRWLAFNM